MRITNPCGNAHFQNVYCRECERLRRIAEKPTDKAKAREKVDAPVGASGDEPQPSNSSRGGKRVVESSGNAARCKRYREAHKEEYRKRNRERMRRARMG